MIRATRLESGVLLVVDLLIVSAFFSAAYALRFQYGWLAVVDVPPPPARSYAEALAVVLVVFVVVIRNRGLYEALPARSIDSAEDCIAATSFAICIVLAASFFYREFSYSRSVGLMAWGSIALTLPLARVLLAGRRKRRWARGLDLVPAVIVGSSEHALGLARRLRDRNRYGLELRGQVTNTVHGEGEGELEGPDGLPVLGGTPRLKEILNENGIGEVLVCDTLERLELLEVLEACERAGVQTRVVPHIYDLFVAPGDLTELHGVPFVSVREQRFESLSLFVKRVFDLLAGTALLLLSLPVILVLGVLIKRESAGPALFVQRRVGLGGRVFNMWKLRSMVVDAEERLGDLVDLDELEEPVFKLDDDPRVTPVGRFLRRWSLDELPQLWNVVLGNMSLVGPRPEVEPVVERYDAHHRRRLKAKPGVTGLQQVEARATAELDERVRLDVYYVRRRSFLFDLWILVRTPWAVIHGRGAV